MSLYIVDETGFQGQNVVLRFPAWMCRSVSRKETMRKDTHAYVVGGIGVLFLVAMAYVASVNLLLSPFRAPGCRLSSSEMRETRGGTPISDSLCHTDLTSKCSAGCVGLPESSCNGVPCGSPRCTGVLYHRTCGTAGEEHTCTPVTDPDGCGVRSLRGNCKWSDALGACRCTGTGTESCPRPTCEGT